MPAETILHRALTKIHRVDGSERAESPLSAGTVLRGLLLTAIAAGFVLYGGGSLEPTDAEARLGLAAGETIAPFGQVLGGWDPAMAPGQVLLSQLWAWLEGGTPTTGAIRWPSALAAMAIGLLMARRVAEALGARAGVFAAFAILGTLAMVDRSAALGIDALAGLAIIGALDRILARGSDWVAGLWAAAAVLLGGWPALATILLPTVVIGRAGAALSKSLLLPPIGVFLTWSCWAWSVAKVEVWAASLTLPLTHANAWTLGLWAVALGLPWAPLAALVAWPAIRRDWDSPARSMVIGWLQVAGVGLLAGMLIPGLGGTCLLPVLVGLAVAAAAGVDRAWSGGLSNGPRRTATGLALVLGVAGGGIALYVGSYLTIMQPYYRVPGFVLLFLGVTAGLMALDAAWTGSTRNAVRVLVLVAIGVKVAHGTIYMPELNYRTGKGPWGRAVGQYVPPGYPIYTFHNVSPALAFATEHPVRRLRAEIYLKVMPSDGPKFVLLTLSEFEHWPEEAPKLIKVRDFQDEYGGARVLARTEGRLVRIDKD